MGDDTQDQRADDATGRVEVDRALHDQLLQRDHVIGIEAEVGRQNAQILKLSGELRAAKGQAARLRKRKVAQAKRIRVLRRKLEEERQRNGRLSRRVAELEQSRGRPSLARRVARRLRSPGR